MATDYADLLKKLDEQSEGSERVKTAADIKQEIARSEAETRRKLATRFIAFYFGILVLILVGIPLYNGFMHQHTPDSQSLMLNVKEILQIYSSIVGPLAGFVIAYYFKNR
jgi:formate hydrogenlyase subunit 3/multisubunit Na+/H+ antiporter MnhD subunit